MTCFIPHDDCPITERWEGSLSCLQRDCDWTYLLIEGKSMTELTCPPCSADIGISQPDGDPKIDYTCPVCEVVWSPPMLCAEVKDLARRFLRRR